LAGQGEQGTAAAYFFGEKTHQWWGKVGEKEEDGEPHLWVARIGLGTGGRGGAAEQRPAGDGGGAGHCSGEGVEGSWARKVPGEVEKAVECST